jgi:hypothetical protein
MTKPRRNKTVYVRLTEAEYKELAILAKKMGTDKSGAIRQVLAVGGKLMGDAIKDGKLIVERT